eukprot:4693127-Alexandrium_andersonii.AAC.1
MLPVPRGGLRAVVDRGHVRDAVAAGHGDVRLADRWQDTGLELGSDVSCSCLLYTSPSPRD